jgi:hypothetical protein
MGQIAGGVISVFASFVSHRSSAFFRVMRLIDFETQLTAFLHPASLVSCHNFFTFSFFYITYINSVHTSQKTQYIFAL